MSLPFASAADENKAVIFEVLKPHLSGRVLEIGSGTGQHAVYFASQFTEIYWQTSDLEPNLPGIAARIDDAGLGNLPPPIALDVQRQWPAEMYDLVYSANCFHIMDKAAVKATIAGAAACLAPDGCLAVYGPFNYRGSYTAASNARFDHYLRTQDPASGLRDFEWLDAIACKVAFKLLADHAMPANNRCLVWQKRTF